MLIPVAEDTAATTSPSAWKTSHVLGALPPSPCAWACVATILSSARRVSAFDAAAGGEADERVERYQRHALRASPGGARDGSTGERFLETTQENPEAVF